MAHAPFNAESVSSEQPSGSVRVCVLASGSKGNATYISNGSAAVLVDAGLSGVEIERRLASRGLNPDTLDAILVTHEHSDHIKGVGVLSRRFKLPVYLNRKTEAAASTQLGRLHDRRYFECGTAFRLNRFTFHPFSISHDAEDPAGFTVDCSGKKIGIATDLGIASHVVKAHLSACSLLILEANHDPEMLEYGPYPWPLKQRVSGRTGHLSNEASRDLLESVQHKALSHVILAHLSEVNNTPNHAFSTVIRGITRSNPKIHVACQDESGEIVELI